MDDAMRARVLERHTRDHPGEDHRILKVEPGYGREVGLTSSDWIVTLSYTQTVDEKFDGNGFVEVACHIPDRWATYAVVGDDIRLWAD